MFRHLLQSLMSIVAVFLYQLFTKSLLWLSIVGSSSRFLTLRTTPIGVFPEYFSFSHFFGFLLLLLEKKKLSSLDSVLNFTWSKLSFCRPSFCCAANQYSEIAWIFSNILKKPCAFQGLTHLVLCFQRYSASEINDDCRTSRLYLVNGQA